MRPAPDNWTSRRTPGWPLAVTLGVHVLLVWCWRIGLAPLPAREDSLVRASTFILLPPPAAVAAPVAPAASRPAARRLPPRAPAQAAAPSVPAERPALETVETPYADPLAEPDQAGAPAGTLAGRARSQAGAVDQALRKGKLAPLTPVDTPWKRFVSAVEGAHRDTSRTLTSESYTSPDGVTIYRFRRGSKIYCRIGGGVRPRIGGAEGGGAANFDVQGGGGTAGLVACPNNAEFKRD